MHTTADPLHSTAIPNLFALGTLTSIKSANHLHNTLSSLSPPRTTPLNVFLQLNTSSEPQKAGLAPSTSADSDLLALATHIVEKCPTLRLRGLMTIGSFERQQDLWKEAAEGRLKGRLEGRSSAVVCCITTLSAFPLHGEQIVGL